MIDLRQIATDALIAYGIEGRALYTTARLSHLCIRTATVGDYEAFCISAGEIGRVHERTHKNRPVAWVELNEPVTAHGIRLDWLEIPAPKPDKSYLTGAQALVYKDDVAAPCELPSLDGSDFLFRFQNRSATQIIMEHA